MISGKNIYSIFFFNLGLVLNMVGGIMYSWVKYHEGERKKRDKLSGDSSTSTSPESPNNNEVPEWKENRKICLQI